MNRTGIETVSVGQNILLRRANFKKMRSWNERIFPVQRRYLSQFFNGCVVTFLPYQ